ncbi:MAG TPA: thioesterase domain-containing protein [Candidatus Angelobacter sp.]
MTDMTTRLAGLSPEKLKLLAREIKKRNAELRNQPDAGGVPASVLAPIRTAGTNPPLFLAHPVGGGVIAYHDLAKYLRAEQPVYALQNLDSSDEDEQKPLRIEDMAARYIEAIKTVCPDGPYLLGGSSMGGTVAFEMGVQLRAQNRPVSLIAMLDTPARVIPHMTGQEGHSPLAVELATLASIIASGYRKQCQLSLADLDVLKPEEQIHSVFHQLQQQQLISANSSSSAFRIALMAFVKNLNALEKYVPRTYDGEVAIVRAQDTSSNMKETAGELSDDPTYGWQAYCTQPVKVRFVPGDHVQMNLEPHVRLTGAELQRFLDEAREN